MICETATGGIRMKNDQKEWLIFHERTHEMWTTMASSFREALNNIVWRIRTSEGRFLKRNNLDGFAL
jgi:hypothetical protein